MDVLVAAALTRVEALGLVGYRLHVVVKMAVELRQEIIEPRRGRLLLLLLMLLLLLLLLLLLH